MKVKSQDENEVVNRVAVDQADLNPSQDEAEDILTRLVEQRQYYLPATLITIHYVEYGIHPSFDQEKKITHLSAPWSYRCTHDVNSKQKRKLHPRATQAS